MTFAVGENGEFTLIEYREPVDGAEYMESIYEMFPENCMMRLGHLMRDIRNF